MMTETHDFVKHDPLSLKYIRIVKIFLWSLGEWPGEILGEHMPLFIRFQRYYCPMQSFLCFIGQITYLYMFSKTVTFFVLGHCIVTTFLCVMTIIRVVLPCLKQYGKLTHQYLFSIHLLHFKHKGEQYSQMHQFIERVSYYYTLFLTAMMVGGMILFNLTPVYKNYKIGAFTGSREPNITLEFSVYYIYPFFNQVEQFKIATIFNFYLSYVCSVSICMLDLMLSLMVFQIYGHIQILRRNLSNFPRPKTEIVIKDLATSKIGSALTLETYDAEENEIVHKLLSECVEHHRLILGFTNDLSSFFGPMLGVNYAFHLVSCCLLLLECTRDFEAALGFGPLTIIIFGQLILISITFEVVGTVSEKLMEDVYEVPWDCMNTKNRRTVCFLLSRLQTPIRVTAMGLTTVGVTTMTGILKTTFSYFAFLRSMNK